jgi:hypothetical protein
MMMMIRSRYAIGRLGSQCASRCKTLAVPQLNMKFSTQSAEPKVEQVVVTQSTGTAASTTMSSNKGM